MRKPIIAGNWKMNKTVSEAIELASDIKDAAKEASGVEVVIAPPFPALYPVFEVIKNSQVKLAAQNLFWEEEGAYTGEVSAKMLRDVGCEYVIIGHSERRQYFGETDGSVKRKILRALDKGLIPIVCIGESLEDREKGDTFSIVEGQIKGALEGMSADDVGQIVIAYEPIWAIGTGKTATSGQAEEVHLYIRKVLSLSFGKDPGERIRIQYGGSVNPDNIGDLMAQPDIDGALVGGASLKAESFRRIIGFNPTV